MFLMPESIFLIIIHRKVINEINMSGKKQSNKNRNLQTILKIISYLKYYKRYIITVLTCLISSSIIVYFQPLIIQKITDFGMVEKNLNIIVRFVIILLLLIVTSQSIEVLQSFCFIKMYNTFYFDLMSKGFYKIVNLKIAYFTDKNSAQIIDNIKTDVSKVASIVDQSFGLAISSFFHVISGIAGLLTISWKLTLIVVLMIPIKYIFVNLLSKLSEKLTEEQIQRVSLFTDWFSDIVNGIKEIKLWGLHNKKYVEFSKKQKEILKNTSKITMISAWNTFIETILEWLIAGIIYILGGLQILNGSLTIGGVFAFVSYCSYVTGPIIIILNLKFMISSILPSARRLFYFFEMEEEMGNYELKEKCIPNVIEFKNVSFSYRSDKIILNNFNLKIQPGEKIAIIGDNGSGKSTFLNLLLRFYEPSGGSITLGNKNIREINLKNYRDMFAVVSQEPYLFADIIRNNINLDGKANNQQYTEACINSRANLFIKKMPEKDCSLIGKNGSYLSGGEKQKIAVARAMIKDAAFIVFDEATTGFDVESEKYLQQIVKCLANDKTLIMITHNYQYLEDMDHVYHMENGRAYEMIK